jgi:FkbM family methyltransferase
MNSFIPRSSSQPSSAWWIKRRASTPVIDTSPTQTFNTRYGLVTLYKNEVYIGDDFKKGKYWDEDTLLKLKEYVHPNRTLLEIGGHCGTSSLVYASFLDEDTKLHVYEPQKNMYDLLVKNINQNNLQHKIIPNHSGVFCYTGDGRMNNIDIDGGGGVVQKRYTEETHLNCNFGGISLGNDGEEIRLTTIDSMNLDDVGYIHCDAQGAENFIFSKGVDTITKCKPVILYEENVGNGLYNNVCKSYPNFEEESKFSIKKYCMEELGYSKYYDNFNGSSDTLLLP